MWSFGEFENTRIGRNKLLRFTEGSLCIFLVYIHIYSKYSFAKFLIKYSKSRRILYFFSTLSTSIFLKSRSTGCSKSMSWLDKERERDQKWLFDNPGRVPKVYIMSLWLIDFLTLTSVTRQWLVHPPILPMCSIMGHSVSQWGTMGYRALSVILHFLPVRDAYTMKVFMSGCEFNCILSDVN